MGIAPYGKYCWQSSADLLAPTQMGSGQSLCTYHCPVIMIEPILSPKPERTQYPCNECAAGIMHLRHITYFTWLGEELITVPHFPAWICDVCGKREYDQRSISWLTMLLSPDAGKPTQRVKRTPTPGPVKRNHPRPPLE